MKHLIASVILVCLIYLMGNKQLSNAELFLAISHCLIGQYLSQLFVYVFNGGRIL